MRITIRQLLLRIGAVIVASAAMSLPAQAGGFLWLGSEIASEGSYYRYNIDTNTVDVSVSLSPPASTHWNNMATDCRHLYIGNPTTQYFGIADQYSGQHISDTTYNPSLSGHKEDGAFNFISGTFWRATFSGNLLHETNTDGTLVQSYSDSSLSGIVGLEWVGDTLYATKYSARTIGRIDIDGTSATYTEIPWDATGDPGSGTADALAYDQHDDVLYLIANNHSLYVITFPKGMAHAEFVVDLSTVGFPSGGLIDGMGWVPPPCGADIAPAPCGNHVVNVDDLLAVINAWGSCAKPCPPACDADIAPADVGDCEVNVDDLLAIINAWGDCP